MSGDLVFSQRVNKEIIDLLKGKEKESMQPCERISSISSTLSNAPEGFSISHLTYDIHKLLKSLGHQDIEEAQAVDVLMDLLILRYSGSFRPAPKDPFELLRGLVSNQKFSSLGAMLKLLYYALSNQLGNPKGTFQSISEELLPILQLVDNEILAQHADILKKIISLMFVSQPNMICVSGYISANEAIPNGHPDSKKRKVPSSYVSSLFKNLSSEFSSSLLIRAVLAGYVSSKRSSAEDVSTEDDNEFEFFRVLLQCTAGNEIQRIELWNEFEKLRIYKLRDEKFTEKHRQFLSEFLDSSRGINGPSFKWKSLRTTLSIDPTFFTDTITNLVVEYLNSGISDAVESHRTLVDLFRSHATKGILSILIDRFANDCHQFNLALVLAEILHEISSHDLRAIYDLLLPKIHDSNCGNFARTTLVPIIGVHGMERLTENMYAYIAAQFKTYLASIQTVKIEKSQRNEYSQLILQMVDGLRKIHIAESIPRLVDPEEGEITSSDEITLSLNWIAQKDSKFRASALLRLMVIDGQNFHIEWDNLNSCKNADKQIEEFVGENFLNREFLIRKFGETCGQVQKSVGAVTNSRPVDFDTSEDDIESLLSKSTELLEKYDTVLFTPASLRSAGEFPLEVISLETTWSNRGSSDDALVKDAVRVLVEQIDRKESDITPALYGLTVIIEQIRRNNQVKQKLGENVSELVGRVAPQLSRISILAKARWLLAIHQLVPGTALQLLIVAHDLIFASGNRSRSIVDCAYFCMFQSITTGLDKKRIRSPWWSNQMTVVIVVVRGLIGACISGVEIAAHHVVRLWKTIIDAYSSEKFFKISKPVVTMIQEYIRLSHKITNADSSAVLDKGCCLMLNKLTKEDKEHCHAMLGPNDREALKRINDLFEKNYKYTGKV